MAKCRPSKWVPWAFLGAGLPLLAAYTIHTNGLTGDINSRATAALTGNEQTAWASIEQNGRDFVLNGTAPSQDAVDAAVKSVAGTYGVRTLGNKVQIVEPVKMTAPTVESINSLAALPEIKGTWNEGVATALAVTVAGATYKLGENPELTSNAGNWLLKPTQPLAEGTFDVTVESTDGKTTMGAAAPGKLVVDLPEPVVEPAVLAAPTVENYLGNMAMPVLKGTWPEVEAKAAEANLEVKVGETAYKLGESAELKSDGTGNWQLTPSIPLVEGELNIMPSVIDKSGKALATAVAAASAVIDLTPPVVPQIAAPAADVKWPYAITGSWPEAKGNTLTAKVGDRMYSVNRGTALTSDGQGNFSFLPSAKFAPGSYDIDFTVNDAAGNSTVQTAKAAIVIPELVATTPAIIDATPAVVDAVPADAKWPYAITGTWDEKPGNTLSAAVAGRTYVLGRGAALTSDGAGKFNFAPSATLAPGSYDVDFTTNDATGEPKVTKLAAAIVVPEPAPAPEPAPVVVPATAPVIEAIAADAKWPYAITGMWDEKPGHTLSAAVAGRTYVLGRGAALTSDGSGKFNFAPSAKLAPGSYDIDFTTNDATGEPKVTKVTSGIVVPEPAPALEPTPVIVPANKAVVDAIAADAKWPYAITGTWDEKPGHTLSASVQGRTYVLGRGAALTSDGAGKFNFAPSSRFAPGKYDVVFATNDATAESKLTFAQAAIVVPEPPAPTPPPPPPKKTLPAPTVVGQVDLTGAPMIKGTWPHDKATVLAVNVSGRNYVLGRDANLRAKDGNWTLFPGSALADGKYDVKVGVADAEGVLGKDETKDELIVDGTPPASPTVISMSGEISPAQLKGTWDQANTKGLKISVPQVNLVAELGAAASPLRADGAGNWVLDLAQPLPVGTYNVTAESVDEHGRVQIDSTEGEVIIVAKGVELPKPVIYDCVAVMTRIGNVFPIRFEYDLTDITKPFDLSVSQYAALLKDPRCTSLNIDVMGHADFKGSEEYNVGLSERRAGLIVNMLKDAGVDAGRMSIKALGESLPLDPAETDEARMKNRRVEITVKQ